MGQGDRYLVPVKNPCLWGILLGSVGKQKAEGGRQEARKRGTYPDKQILGQGNGDTSLSGDWL